MGRMADAEMGAGGKGGRLYRREVMAFQSGFRTIAGGTTWSRSCELKGL